MLAFLLTLHTYGKFPGGQYLPTSQGIGSSVACIEIVTLPGFSF